MSYTTSTGYWNDLPCRMHTRYGPLLSIPYGFELNDSLIYERQSSPELQQRVRDRLKTFDPKLKRQPRVLSIGWKR
jgi:allantoinase